MLRVLTLSGCWENDHSEPEPPQGVRTASKSLWAFYLYSWAIEVYAVVSLTLFLPITLETYARENGKLASDHTRGCQDEPTSPCQVQLLCSWINTASFSLYTYSISVALQALMVICISSAANDPGKRKTLLAAFTLMGACSCILFILVPSQTILWPVSSVLTILGNVAFGAAMVCLNSYLPVVARQQLRIDSTDGHEANEPPFQDVRSIPVTPDPFPTEDMWQSEISKITSQISSKGIAAGYAAGIILLSFMLVPVTLMKGSLLSLRLSILASGAWWLFFSIPAFVWLPSEASNANPKSFATTWKHPWTELYQILREYRRIPETFKYLLAWFVMSDAFATITSTAVLFAKNTLGMPASSLILVGVLTPIFGILGALAWPILQSRVFKNSNLATLRIIVDFAVLIPLYGLILLHTPMELYLLACYFGALYGALQSYSHAIFASLIPPRQEARFFALYSITDKSSSFIGPAVVAVIADVTGSIRAGFLFLLVALVLPLPILAWVDVDQGTQDAQAMGTES